MSFECFFSSNSVDYELWIEDDDRVCYAYLLNTEGNIFGKVWIYNRAQAPERFGDARGVPPRNPAQFVADGDFSLPLSGDEFSAQWYREGDVLYARVFIRKGLVAILAPGTDPGWSVLAKKDGPVAKVLKPSSQSNLAAIIRDIRALDAADGTAAPQEPAHIEEEMTATGHRGRENFKKNHPHPERRIPKDERRRIRIENRAAWATNWDEGQYDHLPRWVPDDAGENRPRGPSRRPLIMRTEATLDEVLQVIADELDGAPATDNEIRLLRDRLPAALVPDWLVDALGRYRLAGTDFSLTEEQDLSGLGADLVWLTPKQMIGEACEMEPGFTIVPSGFLPFGGCSVGTGDPFFLDMRDGSNDPPVVRVPHDYAGGGSYPLDALELVAPSLTAFLKISKVR
jgi:hypothetical protein